MFDEHKERILELRELGLSYKKISDIIQLGTAPSVKNYLDKLELLKEAV